MIYVIEIKSLKTDEVIESFAPTDSLLKAPRLEDALYERVDLEKYYISLNKL